MSSALSVDLRQRVVGIVAACASRHKAAERFGVSRASASRWCQRFARDGHVAPKPMGGDQRSHQIEARADLIVSLYEAQPGIYLHELRAALAEHGICVAQRASRASLSATASREKKRQATRPSRTGRTSELRARRGSRANSTSTRIASCSSTRPQPTPPWSDYGHDRRCRGRQS